LGLPSVKTDAYRLVHGEGDNLSGLIIDVYAKVIVIQCHSIGMHKSIPFIAEALKNLFSKGITIYNKSGNALPSEYSSDQSDGFLQGEQSCVEIQENGHHFSIDLVGGQKTGFFLDQRENRARVESLVAEDKGIQRVLNVFAYTGAFSLYAARGGASVVTSVELSRPALEAAEANFVLNRHIKSVVQARHETMAGDAFEVLDLLSQAEHLFDLVVIDPPSFARRQSEVEGGLWAYGQLTRLGLGVLRPGGMLVFSSCSSRITAESFFDVVFQAAQREGSVLHEIGRSGHPLDHPVGFPEGAYLKCLYAVSG
jgi:23S rRNA (cytosine1962-C5)-methyltransferase